MSHVVNRTIDFKFRLLDDNGNETGFFRSKRGSFDGEILRLEEAKIAADSMYNVTVRDKFMSVTYMTDQGEIEGLAFSVYKTDIKELKQSIDISRSDKIAQREQQRLIEAGQADGFRTEICPHCQATISLNNLPQTPQTFCDFCETLFTVDGHLDQNSLDRDDEKTHRLCDDCGMYAHPRRFSIFYFYFLLVVYGWSYRKTYRCPGCMRGDAWKMFFVNMFGVLGLPVAVMQLVRSYFPGGSKGGKLKGLDNANVLANKGKIEKALDSYESLMDSLPLNAGLKYNIGSGLATKGDFAHAEPMYQMSLEDCANYWPSLQGLLACYQMQEKTDELNQLRLRYGVQAED